jgi:hypothetical protein
MAALRKRILRTAGYATAPEPHIASPASSEFGEGVFGYQLEFPPTYPLEPPTVEFTGTTSTGPMCLELADALSRSVALLSLRIPSGQLLLDAAMFGDVVRQSEQTAIFLVSGKVPVDAALSADVPVDLGFHGEVSQLFERARNEDFRDGMETQFASDIADFIERAGQPEIGAIASKLGAVNPDVVAETLRALGRSAESTTRDQRLSILASHLHSGLPLIRDAAILGLVDLEDPNAVPALRRALDREPTSFLKTEMRRAIDLLERAAS